MKITEKHLHVVKRLYEVNAPTNPFYAAFSSGGGFESEVVDLIINGYIDHNGFIGFKTFRFVDLKRIELIWLSNKGKQIFKMVGHKCVSIIPSNVNETIEFKFDDILRYSLQYIQTGMRDEISLSPADKNVFYNSSNRKGVRLGDLTITDTGFIVTDSFLKITTLQKNIQKLIEKGLVSNYTDLSIKDVWNCQVFTTEKKTKREWIKLIGLYKSISINFTQQDFYNHVDYLIDEMPHLRCVVIKDIDSRLIGIENEIERFTQFEHAMMFDELQTLVELSKKPIQHIRALEKEKSKLVEKKSELNSIDNKQLCQLFITGKI
jgi:hypothetical protein